MQKIFILLFLPLSSLWAQQTLSGHVLDTKGNPLPFANIALVGSYDGATSDSLGYFAFETESTGLQKLKASMMGYETQELDIDIQGKNKDLAFRLRESINSLNAVVVTAGMFEASDEKRMVMMKPLDIVTTAGGQADIVTVMQNLPGATRVGEQSGLFVRGGSANETKTLIDGMIVQNPFFSSTPDVPQRGRFSPFMFKGTSFSTGGYSAQYGQALSSVLLLNTMDKQGENSNLNVLAHMAGLSASYTHKGWITGTLNYNNIAPFLALSKTNIDFETIPKGLGGSLMINEEFKNKAQLKAYSTFSNQNSGINLPTFDGEQQSTYLFSNNNLNAFNNASYRQSFKDGLWTLWAGGSYSHNRDKLEISEVQNQREDERSQGRLVLSRLFGRNNASTFTFGGEYHHIQTDNNYNGYAYSLKNQYTAAFAETEFYFSAKLAFRVGLRAENNTVIHRSNIAPRISLAYKLNKDSQLSFASGRFYQNPELNYLVLNKSLKYEIADHYILNYQLIKNRRTFRTEVFYKRYDQLVKEKVEGYNPNPYRFPTGELSNKGNGFAQGFDLFFRDQKTLPNGDFWITYSFLDTKRDFMNYTQKAMPSFASRHNFSLVYKQFFTGISTNIGFTFSHTSGRPIYTLNEDFKQVEYTKPFESLSLMASHVKIIGSQTWVFFASLDNALGRKNVFGYRYSDDGSQHYPVKPILYRTFFCGVSVTFGQLNGRSKEADLNF
ncbi:TonB-dependent receptor [Marinilongibacter aquaticus]|uniref:TonB-dependent receptor n=1 Tax=Marinilongibacter aquaticus TaxID=2975157 RepID=UPI0021BDDEF6|nr:TonB-dependent receptor [Marinilongibacter aquaticus]UBM57199.1 TonB-dependent receptor [Marinilongibacter aquaticus]